MPAVIPILFGWLFTVAACYSAGLIALRGSSRPFYREEVHFFRYITGSGCFSLLVFFLTAIHAAYQGVFLASGALIIAGAVYLARTEPRGVRLPDFPWLWKLIFLAAFLSFGVYYFIHALAPETSPDGATYHLGLVGRYLRQHSFGHITTDMYANLSEAIEMLFLVAFSTGRHSAAALVEFTFLLALPYGMLCYARRIGFPKAGVLASLIVYCSPVFGMSGTIAYNDAAGAAILFALFYLLQIWAATRETRLIPVLGVTAGFCYGAKYTLFLALPFAGLFLIWHLLRARSPLVKPLAVYSVCALVLVVPWMVKNYLTVQNPFSPFANRLFHNPYVTVHFEQEYGTLMRNREGLTVSQRPLDHIVKGERTAGILGPVFLLAPLALLALRFRPGRQLLFAFSVFLLPAFANVETRFLMPMAPFLALSLALALTDVPFGIPIVLAFQLLTAWPSNVRAYAAPNAWILDGYHPEEAFRLVPETTTLSRRMPSYEVAQLIESFTPPDAKVFSFSGPPEAYTSREILVKYESALGNTLGEMLWAPLLPDYQPSQELTFRFDRQPVSGVKLVQTAKHPVDSWSVSEVNLFDGGQDIPIDQTAQLTASVNPWDLPLLIDHLPITRWSTAEPVRPGMFLQADLRKSVFLDSLKLLSPPEWNSNIRLSLKSEQGEWHMLQETPERREISVQPNLRSEATGQLKQHGISFLLIDNDDFGHDDFFVRQSEWKLQLVGEAQGSRLYQLL